MKKLIAFVLSLAIVGGVMPAVGGLAPDTAITASAEASSGTCGESLTWTLDDEGTLTISGTGDMYNYSFNEKSPFYGNLDIKNVIIEDGITSIGALGFYYCESLESITIPASVISIGDSAFYFCKSLTSVTIPDSVASIGYHAFFNCASLESVTISDSVTSISDCAFGFCTNLRMISVDEGNPNYKSTDGILFDKGATKIICYPASKTETYYVIPDSVTSISPAAFFGCKSLKSVTIPDSVTSIGSDAFFLCVSIESIIIPNSVKSIGDSAFRYCENMGSITIPDSVTSISSYMFSDCTNLRSVTIPDSAEIIGDCAFYKCTSLTSVIIPDSVTSIGQLAFFDCTSLGSITILDPECEIDAAAETICNGYDDRLQAYFNGIIYGYSNSTAQEYAEKYGYTFEPLGEAPFSEILGDVDGNEIVDGRDASMVLTHYALISTQQEGIIPDEYLGNADWDQNEIIDGRDASAILTYYAEQSVNKS